VEHLIMPDNITKVPVTNKDKTPAPIAASDLSPFDELRHEVNRLLDGFGRGNWLRPFRGFSLEPALAQPFPLNAPAVDVAEKDTAFEITAELPGMDPKDIDVSTRNGNLVIKGEKHAEKEETSKDYYVKERQYGAFERSFSMPDGVDVSAIEAIHSNGLLKVTLPKTAAAQKPATKIEVKAA
jgi:HSP20 family protein